MDKYMYLNINRINSFNYLTFLSNSNIMYIYMYNIINIIIIGAFLKYLLRIKFFSIANFIINNLKNNNKRAN